MQILLKQTFYSVRATVSFDIVLGIEADNEDDVSCFAHEILTTSCNLAADEEFQVDNYFAHVDVRSVEEVDAYIDDASEINSN